jgi:hypothetical protein
MGFVAATATGRALAASTLELVIAGSWHFQRKT